MPKSKTRWQTVKDYAVYLCVRTFVCVIQATPIEVCAKISSVLGRFIARKIRNRAKVLEENISQTFPDWTETQREELAASMWEHLLLMACEVAHAPRKIHETNWRKYFKIANLRAMVTVGTELRPRVVVTGHFGNFELGGYITGLLGFPSYTIARTLDNLFLDRYVNQFRQMYGQYTIPNQGNAALVQKVMQSGGTISVLGDQHAGMSGIWVDFLGREASCHKALALFTLTGGAPMVISYARRLAKPMHFEIGVRGIADPDNLTDQQQGVRQLTQWYNDKLKEIIMMAPEQYWWLHRRWRNKYNLRRQRKLRAASIAASRAA